MKDEAKNQSNQSNKIKAENDISAKYVGFKPMQYNVNENLYAEFKVVKRQITNQEIAETVFTEQDQQQGATSV